MKKVLIITYYWPPSGGAGVQRWLKFVKYLREFGWEPIVYTPENPEAPANDETLLKDIPNDLEVIKRPIWEPYSLYKKFVGLKKEDKINAGFLTEKKKPGIAEKLSVWVRGNYFIPDARKFWVKPSINYLIGYLNQHKIDVVVTTGPPHSLHLIGLELKKQLNICWLADFRDPWTDIDFYDKLMLSEASDEKHKALEKEVLTHADAVTAIGWDMANKLEKIRGRQVEVIPNGYDESDFIGSNATPDPSHFVVAHFGALNADRNPHVLWESLRELSDKNDAFKRKLKIQLVGKTDIKVLADIEKHGLSGHLEKIDYLNHREATEGMQRSNVLLLAINQTPNAKGVITGKIFEYLATGRPILGIGPTDGDAAKIINETGAGCICDFNDKNGVINYLKEQFESAAQVAKKDTSLNYSRKELTRRLADVLKKTARA